MFVISHGPDEEWFDDEQAAHDAAQDWSAHLGGQSILLSRLTEGRVIPQMEVSV